MARTPRAQFDLFAPDGPSVGLVVFVHGGYWMRGDKSLWSHLAEGARAHGWTVVLPSYPLAPEVGLDVIVEHIAQAVIAAADRVDGPIRLVGHSAGGPFW